jgi:hypothetical protein
LVNVPQVVFQNLKKSVHLLKDVVAVHQTLDFLCSQFNQVDLSLEVTEQGLEFLTIFLLLCIHFSEEFHSTAKSLTGLVFEFLLFFQSHHSDVRLRLTGLHL